jgi:hypothetical protein
VAAGEAKLPDMPETFLPTVADEQAKKNKKGKPPAKSPAGQAEFVGPRGHQEPK